MKKAWKYRMIPVALMLLLSGCGHFTELVEHVASKQETTAEETQAILETTIPAEQVVEPADSDAMRIELSQGQQPSASRISWRSPSWVQHRETTISS